MPDPVTTNVLLVIQSHGSNVDSWDGPLNGDFSGLDGFLAGVQPISAAGASPITLTAPTGTPTPAGGPTQAQNAVLRFTGILTGNVQITLPLPGYMIIENLTTGSFVLSFRAVSSGEVIGIEQGSTQHIYNDGTNVRFVNLPPVGTYLDICDATVPAWITACTKPPYLNCDGTTFSAATYPYLNGKLGGSTLPDMRGGFRGTLNQGTGRLTTASGGLDGNTRFARGGAQNYTLSQSNLPNITLSYTQNLFYQSAPSAYASGSNGAVQDIRNTTAPGYSPLVQAIQMPLGGSGTAYFVVPPATIGGITLIRAG
jgi:hypothetical protein